MEEVLYKKGKILIYTDSNGNKYKVEVKQDCYKRYNPTVQVLELVEKSGKPELTKVGEVGSANQSKLTTMKKDDGFIYSLYGGVQ